jgi:hypothetical protein
MREIVGATSRNVENCRNCCNPESPDCVGVIRQILRSTSKLRQMLLSAAANYVSFWLVPGSSYLSWFGGCESSCIAPKRSRLFHRQTHNSPSSGLQLLNLRREFAGEAGATILQGDNLSEREGWSLRSYGLSRKISNKNSQMSTFSPESYGAL